MSAIDETRLRNILTKYRDDDLTLDQVLSHLKKLPYQDLGFAKVDHHRSIRTGFPEVIFGQGKTPQQISSIAEVVLSHSERLLVTRASHAVFDAVKEKVPDAIYEEQSKAIVVDRRETKPLKPGLLVVCAGTADLPVAYEAITTAELMDCKVDRLFDVGVAGIHRLLDNLTILLNANVIIVVAGMEGALPSVIGGLVNVPVIAVPTSIGYGSNFEGLAALLAMLNSCASGIGVVNIDNGFGAGYLASLINA